MTYQEAKDILRDAVAPQGAESFEARLSNSPGQLSLMDTSTRGELPEGDSYGDKILQALLVVRREIVGKSTVERELIGMLIFLDVPIRIVAARPELANTRAPQISLILDAISMECLASRD
jgi:hypothetical protein